MTRNVLSRILIVIVAFGLAYFKTNAQQAPSGKATQVNNKEDQLKGYLIANFTIKDSVIFQKYREAAKGVAAKYKGNMILRDVHSKTVEGDSPKTVLAIIEFPSLKDAEQYYYSPEYTTAKKFRIASSESLIILAKGIPKTVQTDTGRQKGYLVANFTIHDEQTFKKYLESGGPLVQKFNGKAIIYDVNAKIVEGVGKQIIAVMEFPSIAGMERFYNSPEYSNARKFRIASTTGSVVLGEGL